MGFFQQQYWSGLPFPPPGDIPDPGIEPTSPVLAGRALPRQRIQSRLRVVSTIGLPAAMGSPHNWVVSLIEGLPRWLNGKESACQAGDSGLIPGSGISPGGEHGNPL